MTDLTPVEVTQADIDAAETAWENAALADIHCDPRNIGPEFGDGPHDPVGVLAVAFARHRQQAIRSNASSSEAVAQHEGELAAYKYSHETAVDLGYPSLTEALEHLSELKDAAQNEGEKETHPKLHKALRDKAKMFQQAMAKLEGDSRAKYLVDTRARMIPGDRNTVQHEGGQGEAVAWMYEHADFGCEVYSGRWGGNGGIADDFVGWTETPLYAHPPATRPAAVAEDEVEALGLVIAKVIYGDGFDPFQNPETCKFGKEIAKPVLSHLSPRITQQAEEVARLESQVYVPGVWRCAKCGYTLILSNRDAAAGDKCPNEGSPLWRVSYEQEVARLKTEMDRRDRNENRNCINWGPCSRHDLRMSDGCDEQPGGEGAE